MYINGINNIDLTIEIRLPIEKLSFDGNQISTGFGYL